MRESPGVVRVRAPKEQHLPVNLSGNRDRTVIRRLWKAVASGCPPTGKGARPATVASPNLSGATTEGEGWYPSATWSTRPTLELP
ncbi:hypothetical protein NCAST_32_09360 [Nocardia asteroides NBRC 15531]|uniref:Uncharacterized protein n=1 Tax=Nocardia asteroides NBRC 15531 TaxID=1110697 RepID=U5EGL2_NOCAS|nr:hypothetical protein NCAST_32_09360 [Nocardia asteroides NBRC 15531]